MYTQCINAKYIAEDVHKSLRTAGHTVLITYLLTNFDHVMQKHDGREGGEFCVIYGNRENTKSSFVE